jgi:hypothetical protein
MKNKPITGNDLIKKMDQHDIMIKDLAEYWEIDRNTVGKYRKLAGNPLPMQGFMRVLFADLDAKFGKTKVANEKAD